MADPLRFVAVDAPHWIVLERLWQLYKHDLSEFRDSHPTAEGLFVTRRGLETIMDDGRHEALLVFHGERLAGFAIIGGRGDETRDVSEFFILRSQRRQHVGARVAASLLDRHHGEWRIAFQEANAAAAAFWRRVAHDAARGEVRESRRPVPERPEIAPDVWLSFST
jgi:predicted acetyltransferase